jgi:hypothetical protein
MILVLHWHPVWVRWYRQLFGTKHLPPLLANIIQELSVWLRPKETVLGPPNDDMGSRIVDSRPRYPFLDQSDIMEHHANRFVHDNTSPQNQFGAFKIYMIYAIGATLLKLTEPYDYTPPENFFMTALQFISAARESHCTNSYSCSFINLPIKILVESYTGHPLLQTYASWLLYSN